ncbi:MAG: RNA polymerase sigma factor [Oscillospiraceae bacterium]|jgi:RNA polymerase sigma-70 factor (ECF subfamily)|nr:RNA polymerase sigma factor [Oscillospiraceae bacterium]
MTATSEDNYRRFLEGDQSGFDAIMEEFQQNLLYFLNGYVHNLSTAEDLAMDTFVEILMHRQRYRFQSSFKTYLFSIARHKAIDYLRREQRRASVTLEQIGEMSDGLPALEDQIIQTERLQTLRKGMEGLPDEYREVLYLLYIENLSYDDIARVMKKNKKQIDNLAYRARQSMRTALGREGIFDEEFS